MPDFGGGDPMVLHQCEWEVDVADFLHRRSVAAERFSAVAGAFAGEQEVGGADFRGG
ncbi:hypothetical protein ABZW10_01915 [Kitasatospora sp. NPDC004723]|uniref:hypothetical protein n=1 Tax=Kitasatospora sp. NPDC004723 TaxID=3154288 RepID=UPI0033AADCB0